MIQLRQPSHLFYPPLNRHPRRNQPGNGDVSIGNRKQAQISSPQK